MRVTSFFIHCELPVQLYKDAAFISALASDKYWAKLSE